MSDGPHRSLKLARHWKKLAECADNAAFSDKETKETFQEALRKDLIKDVPRKLHSKIHEVLEGSQRSLFAEDRVNQLRQLEPMTAGRELAQVYLETAIYVVSQNNHSTADVLALALNRWGARRAYQIEEHYLRESSDKRADHVRSRLEQACIDSVNNDLADQVLNPGKPSNIRKMKKKTGLDDGVQL